MECQTFTHALHILKNENELVEATLNSDRTAATANLLGEEVTDKEMCCSCEKTCLQAIKETITGCGVKIMIQNNHPSNAGTALLIK